MTTRKTALQRARAMMGFSLRGVAATIGLDPAAYHRIEKGEHLPTRDTARRIEKFYRGAIPLGVIYDPAHKTSLAWLREEGVDLIIANAATELRQKHRTLAGVDARA